MYVQQLDSLESKMKIIDSEFKSDPKLGSKLYEYKVFDKDEDS